MSPVDIMTQYLTPFNWLVGLSPILLVSFLMIRLRWSGSRAGALSWFWTIAVAIILFGGSTFTVASGSARGIWETVFVLFIIWGAMAIYGLVDGMKGFPAITDAFNRVTGGDRLLQIYIVGMVFPAWIQGVLGFGTPVAVTAPLMLGLGFDPVVSLVVPSLGHAFTITFGSLGSSYWVLQRFTGLSEGPLALWSAIFFIPVAFMVFFLGTWFYSRVTFGDGWQEVKRGWFAWTSLALIQALVQLLFAILSPSIAGFMAGFAGLVWGVMLRRIPFYRLRSENKSALAEKGGLSFNQAFLPYYAIIVVVVVIYMSPFAAGFSPVPDLRAVLEAEPYLVGPTWPETSTGLGFANPAHDRYSPLAVLTMPGTLIFLALGFSMLVYRVRGVLRPGVWAVMSGRLAKSAVPASLTLMTLGMTAGVMMEHGMTTLLAVGTAGAAGVFYPLVANYVGQLGAFLTGSNTASNVLFSAFQKDTAGVLEINPYIISALQTVGGALGSIYCPMKMGLATASVGITGREGDVIAPLLIYSLIMGLILGLLGMAIITYLPGV